MKTHRSVYLLQFLGVVALASVGDQDTRLVVADDLSDFLVAMVVADLEDGRRDGHEDHHMSQLAPNPPSRVLGGDHIRRWDPDADIA